MKFQTTPERQAKRAALEAYFAAQRDGEELSWLRVESESGVKMDEDGKGMARDALLKVRGRGGYASVRGSGVVLSSPENATAIVDEHGRRVGNAVKHWSATVEQARDKFLDRMSEADKQHLLSRVAFAGALKTMAAGCKVKRLKQG